MPAETKWLDSREDGAWRAFIHAHHQLSVRLNQLLFQNSGMTDADYKVLAVLSEHPTGRISAQELCGLLQWEKSRLSHQVKRMEKLGLMLGFAHAPESAAAPYGTERPAEKGAALAFMAPNSRARARGARRCRGAS